MRRSDPGESKAERALAGIGILPDDRNPGTVSQCIDANSHFFHMSLTWADFNTRDQGISKGATKGASGLSGWRPLNLLSAQDLISFDLAAIRSTKKVA
ncbi:MAG TPA: hypothetical protein VHR66_28225 [Gemmataceae bacterium]|jgi:hypothetical protein|nr:hypothetical protein [Gemmataceae bacterium]